MATLVVGNKIPNITTRSSELENEIRREEFLDITIKNKFAEVATSCCNHCGQKPSVFSFNAGSYHVLPSDKSLSILELYLIFKCNECFGLLLKTIIFESKKNNSIPDDIIYSNPKWQKTFPPIEYDISGELIKHIKPQGIYANYKKALEHLYAKEYEYACSDLRKSLEGVLNEILKKQNKQITRVPAGQKINQISWNGKYKTFKKAVIAIKDIGNLGAHLNSDNVKLEEIKIGLQLMKLLIEYQFIMPEQVKKQQGYNKKRTT